MKARSLILAAGAAIATCTALATTATAANFTEGADVGGTKAAAQVVANWANGETISGTGSSTTDLDYYRVQTAADTAGIYMHRMNLTLGTGSTTVSMRGVLSSNGTGDTQIISRANGEFIKWYGFGKQEEVYFRAGRTGTGTGTYTMTHSVTQITPGSAGTINQGSHTLAPALLGDSEIYLYDSNFNLIGQNDSQTAGNVAASMVYNFTTNGLYYIAIGSGNSTSNVAASGTSPSYSASTTDPFYDSNFGSGARTNSLDFANALARPENLTRTAAEFGLKIDGGATINATNGVSATFGAANQEIAWFVVEVVPAPSSVALLGLGGLVAARRRRN